MADTPQHTYQILTKRSRRLRNLSDDLDWPDNVWMGVSVETERYAFRIDHLRQVGAKVRFVSAEPLLGPLPDLNLADIDWLIAGGESGPGARPMDEKPGSEISATSAETPVSPSSSSNGEVGPRKQTAETSTGNAMTRCRLVPGGNEPPVHLISSEHREDRAIA